MNKKTPPGSQRSSRVRFRSILVLALSVAAFSSPVAGPVAAAQAPGTLRLDLESVVRLALAGNPGLRAVEERRSEVDAGIRQAQGSAYPSVSLVSEWSRARNPSLLNSRDFEDFVNQIPGGSFIPSEQELTRAAFEVRQPLWTGGKIRAAIDLAREIVGSTEAEIGTARLDVAAAAADAYFVLLGARRSLETLEVQRQVRQAALDVVQGRYDFGDATRLELLQAQASLAALAPSVAEVEGRVSVAEERLRTLLGLEGRPVLEVMEPEGAPEGEMPEPEALRTAAHQRPELLQIDRDMEALVDRQVVVAADGRPQVDLTASYGREVRLIEDITDNLFQDWRVGLGFTWQLFDGGQRKSEIEGLESQRRQLDWRRRELLEQIRLEVETALTEDRSARARLKAATLSAEAAQEASRVAAETYAEGVALQADVLTAQERATLAELERVDAYYGALAARARLQRAVGRLPTGEELAVTMPQEPGRWDWLRPGLGKRSTTKGDSAGTGPDAEGSSPLQSGAMDSTNDDEPQRPRAAQGEQR